MQPRLLIRVFSATLISTLLVTLVAAAMPEGAAAPQLTERRDLIIIGAGLAGLSAALEAGRSGAKVLVIDEASLFGGHAIMSEGELNIVGSPLQRARGVEDSPDLAYSDFTKWGEDNDPGWVRYYVEHSKTDIFDWVSALGVSFSGLNINDGSSVPRIHLTAGRGLGLVRPIYQETLKYPNIVFQWNVDVTSLISVDGTVVGARGRNLRTGEELAYRSKAVLLATGGFQSNVELALANWPANLPKPPRLLAGSGVNSKGSGLRLATDVGAALFHLDHQWNYVYGLPDPRYPGLNRGLSISVDGILVNTQGRVFMPSGLSNTKRFAIAVRQPQATYWQLFDDKQKQAFWVSGTGWSNFGTIQRVLIEDASVIKHAATLEQLADATGLPSAELKKSVIEHNQSDVSGKIEVPPFYAAQLFPLARKSMGGIAIDHEARVINSQSKAIRGLYAAGEATGEANINGKQALEGTFLGPAIITGRMAARTALRDSSVRGSAAANTPIDMSAMAKPMDDALCLSCHQLPALVDKPRNGFWHFERVHKIVLETHRDCAQCHAGMADPSTLQHRINPLVQTNSCTICHQLQ